MRSAGIPPNLAAKILNEIPATWAAMYRKLEAAKIPLNNFDRDLAQKVKDSRAASYFIAIDQALYYNAQMLELCDQLKALAMNRAIALPGGEYLDDIIDSFRHIQDYGFHPDDRRKIYGKFCKDGNGQGHSGQF